MMSRSPDSSSLPRADRRLPLSIWVLGFVSLLMDVSSELIHSLLAVFLFSVLGVSAFMVGLIEGLAEATALIVRMFSGALSDYLGRRKALAVIGYGLSALSKPLFALAPNVAIVLAARRAMHWSPISRHRRCAARPSDCVSHWIRSARSSAPCWRWS
jgi:MFS family permease